MDYIVHVSWILQDTVLEWAAFPFSRASSQPRNGTWVSCIAGGFFTNWAIREALMVRMVKKRKQNKTKSAFQSRRCQGHGFNPCVGKFPRVGNGNSIQDAGLENPMDRGGWQATVHGATKSRTWLSECMCATFWSLCIYFTGGRLDRDWVKSEHELQLYKQGFAWTQTKDCFHVQEPSPFEKRFSDFWTLWRLPIKQIMMGKWEVRTGHREVTMMIMWVRNECSIFR